MKSPLNSPKYLCYLPLTRIAPKRLKKTPVFSTTYVPPSPATTCVIYHLEKKVGGEGQLKSSVAPGFSPALVRGTKTGISLNARRYTCHRAPSAPHLTPLFSTLSAKPCTKCAPPNSIIFKHFQTSPKSAPANSFGIIAFQNQALFLLNNRVNPASVTIEGLSNERRYSSRRGEA